MSYQKPSRIEEAYDNLILHLKSQRVPKKLYVTLIGMKLEYHSMTGVITLSEKYWNPSKEVTSATYKKKEERSLEFLQSKLTELREITPDALRSNPNIHMEKLFRHQKGWMLKSFVMKYKETLIWLLQKDYNIHSYQITEWRIETPVTKTIFTPKVPPVVVQKNREERRLQQREIYYKKEIPKEIWRLWLLSRNIKVYLAILQNPEKLKKTTDFIPDELKQKMKLKSNQGKWTLQELYTICFIAEYFKDTNPNKGQEWYLHRSKPEWMPTLVSNNEIIQFLCEGWWYNENQLQEMVSEIASKLPSVIDRISKKRIDQNMLLPWSQRVDNKLTARKNRP